MFTLFTGSSCTFSAASKAFIFSLYNIDGYAPENLTQYDDYRYRVMYHCSTYGPTFGGFDIRISNYALNNKASHTFCGHTYTAPPGYPRIPPARFLLVAIHFLPRISKYFMKH